MSIAYFLTLAFWPLDLFLENSFFSFLQYTVPAALTYLSIINPVFSLVIPLIIPKLTLLPVLILFIFLTINKINKKHFAFLVCIWTVIAIFKFSDFYGQTIFKSDYEAQQQVVRNTQLYNNIFMARLMHNKARIRLDAFNQHLFELIDPGNYFFEFHPRLPDSSNQQLSKFPFIAIVPMLTGFLNIRKIKNYKTILGLIAASLLSLSVLKIYDRHDFILYIPLALIIINGLNIIFKSQNIYTKMFKYIFAAVSLIELVRLILI